MSQQKRRLDSDESVSEIEAKHQQRGDQVDTEKKTKLESGDAENKDTSDEEDQCMSDSSDDGPIDVRDEGEITFDLMASASLRIKALTPLKALQQAIENLEKFESTGLPTLRAEVLKKFPKAYFLPSLKNVHVQSQADYTEPMGLSVRFATIFFMGEILFCKRRPISTHLYYCPLSNLVFIDNDESESGIKVKPVDSPTDFVQLIKKNIKADAPDFLTHEEVEQWNKDQIGRKKAGWIKGKPEVKHPLSEEEDV